MITEIKQLAKDIFSDIVKIRRHLHQNPELSFKEYETSKYIKGVLELYDIEYSDNWVETGIVANIHGKQGEGKLVAIRADIDALPIKENRESSYCSKNEGIMHACGHDVHTASVLGTAIILNKIKHLIKGSIRIIFQPGEEKLPGGASLMLKEGVFENPKPDVIFGQHVHPPLDAGTFGICSGEYMASADEIYIKIVGKGGHAALPQNCIDPILISSHVMIALQEIISRKANPFMPTVLSIGKINSDGGATNVIPNHVRMEGTLRTFNEEWRFNIHDLIKEKVEKIAESFGGAAEVNIKIGYPSLLNDEELTTRTKKNMELYLGTSNCVSLPQRMTAEDFAFYSREIPACFYRMGTGNDQKDTRHSVHTDMFDIDEDALEHSIGLMSWLVWSELNS